MKKLYIDVETGGIEHKKSALLQISGLIEVDSHTGGEFDKFDFKIKPYLDKEVDEKALKVIGVSLEEIKKSPEYKPPVFVFKELIEILDCYVNKYDREDKFHFIGYNSEKFDMPFIRQFFYDNGHKYFGSYFYSPSIDVYILAGNYFKNNRPNIRNLKLSTVARELGFKVQNDKLHDAMYDIELTKKVYEKLEELGK